MKEKPQKIIEETLKLIAKNGFHNSPTSMIARNAGVGTGTIYRYFSSKEELIRAIHEYIRQALRERILRERDETLPVKERFIRLFSLIARYMLDHADQYRFLEQFYYSPFGMNEQRMFRDKDMLPAFFDAAKEQKIIKNIDNDILIALSFGPLLCMVKEHFTGFLNMDDQMIETTVASSWDALKL